LKQHGYKIVRFLTGAAPDWQRRMIDLVSGIFVFKRLVTKNFGRDSACWNLKATPPSDGLIGDTKGVP